MGSCSVGLVVERARVACLAVVALAWLATTPGVARAHDSLAPPDAGHNWLPDEGWVDQHWIPFDERALNVRTRTAGRVDLHAYLYNDHRMLADLARRRGVDPRNLADRLVAPWRGIAASVARCCASARCGSSRRDTSPSTCSSTCSTDSLVHSGVARPVRDAMRRPTARSPAGVLSYVAIAAHGGVSLERLRAGVTALIDRHYRAESRAAKPGRVSRTGSATARCAQLMCWLQQPPVGRDPANPFGKNRFLHGHHDAGWPSTAREWRINERRVEHFRQQLPKCCWPLPKRWR